MSPLVTDAFKTSYLITFEHFEFHIVGPCAQVCNDQLRMEKKVSQLQRQLFIRYKVTKLQRCEIAILKFYTNDLMELLLLN